MTAFGTTKDLRGLALPAIRSQGGYFASKSRYDVAWGDVLLTLFTPIGSRPMNRAFGSGLFNLIFENAAMITREEINFTVRDALERWAPHIRIRMIDSNIEEDRFEIRVTFSLADDEFNAERAVLIPRSDVLNFLAAQRNN